jgi:hypothetical protein
MLPVDVKVRLLNVAIRNIQSEQNRRVHDCIDETDINRLAISLRFNQSDNGVCKFLILLAVVEEVFFPSDEGELPKEG